MKKVTIEFVNGLVLEAEVNGNCYIVDEKPDFPVDLSTVSVTDGGGKTKKLVEVKINEAASVDGRYWFALREMTQQELKDIKIEAKIQYLAMMSDIEL
jgi:hypothetical protein